MRYPAGIWRPWKYLDPVGAPTFYRGTNKPIAVVLHKMQGWSTTAEEWARAGHQGASWSATGSLDGRILEHMEDSDGGFAAGIDEFRDRARTIRNPDPTWPLWRGWGENVNEYTLSLELEGFEGQPIPRVQALAVRDYLRFKAASLGFPYVRERFPAHADIALLDRAHDFDPPAQREEFYKFLFEEEDEPMTPAERKEFDDMKLAMMSGNEERLPRADRLTNANYRIAQRVGDAEDGTTAESLGSAILGHTHK